MLSRFVVSQVKHNSYFLVGVALGLWLALAAVPMDDGDCAEGALRTEGAALTPDEFVPQLEQRAAPGGAAGAGGGGRSVQRPRYYSTELGMRQPLLAAALSSEAALESRVSALNHTMSRLQPALRFFMTASALAAAPGAANVVGFTDTREMLKPFHALKYLADNYLDEYDFFFLVSDGSFVNARRLTELVSALSVSQDLYMGTVAEDDSHYCTLEGGILLSNSVLRAVHGALDWCVRNSYSPHHHENVGRCVLHAAHQACTHHAQGESYVSVRLQPPAEAEAEAGGEAEAEALARAVTAYPAPRTEQLYRLHAAVSRVYLERDAARVRAARGELWRSRRRHPPAYRNRTWPPGLRADPGLPPPPPDTRFDHLRWTAFNATHAFMPDDHTAVAPLSKAYKDALDLVLRAAYAWAARRWQGEGAGQGEGQGRGEGAELVEGAWLWDPPLALRYRLLLRVPARSGLQVALTPRCHRSIRSLRLLTLWHTRDGARRGGGAGARGGAPGGRALRHGDGAPHRAAARAERGRACCPRPAAPVRGRLPAGAGRHRARAGAARGGRGGGRGGGGRVGRAAGRRGGAQRAVPRGRAAGRAGAARGRGRGGGRGGGSAPLARRPQRGQRGGRAAEGRARAAAHAGGGLQRRVPQQGAHEHDRRRVVVPAGPLRPPRAVPAPALRGARHGPQAAAAHGPLQPPPPARARLLQEGLRQRAGGVAQRGLGPRGRRAGRPRGAALPARARARPRAAAPPRAPLRRPPGGGGRGGLPAPPARRRRPAAPRPGRPRAAGAPAARPAGRGGAGPAPRRLAPPPPCRPLLGDFT